MNIFLLRWPAAAFVAGLFTGCAVTGDGYLYDGGMGAGIDYYEPYGVFYGDWGPDYFVAPFRGGDHRPDHGSRRPDRGDHRPDHDAGRSSPHSYRPAPASRPMPSIPSRSGGFRSH